MSEKFSARECALIAAKAADEHKATDIMVLEVGQLVDVAMEDALRIECGVKPFSREETKDHTWELLDYGNFVIDVFQPEAREYYRLETLWNDAPIVDLSEAGIEHPEYSERIAQLVQKMESANDQA